MDVGAVCRIGRLTRTYRKLVANTTINSATLLSTDYLNHFNELVMLIGMAADMPDMVEEARQWRPKTYQEHFADSSFTHKDLACAAYEQAEPENTTALEVTVAQINGQVDASLAELEQLIAACDMDRLRVRSADISLTLQKLIDLCSGIINGVDGATQIALHGEATVDAAVEPAFVEDGARQPEEKVMAQDAIDALFD